MTPPATIIRAPGEGETITAFGDTLRCKLSVTETRGQLSLVHLTTPPGGGPPLHRHTLEDELFIVTAGRFRFVSDDAEHEAAPGAVVWLQRGTVHTFKVTSDTPGQAWVFVLPGGFEDFFRASAEAFIQAAGGPPDMAMIMAAAAARGIEILGPPLS
jgi:quercetin dioxygenase-like cupin family protein